MIRRWFIILLLFTAKSHAQKGHLNLAIGAGASYILNDPSLNRHLDNTRMTGVCYVMQQPTSHFQFHPVLAYVRNAYHGKADNKKGMVHVIQHLLCLDLSSMVKIKKATFLRAGLFFQREMFTNIYVSITEISSRSYSLGNNTLYNGYSPARTQAGVSLGLSFVFKKFNREGHIFSVRLYQYASRIAESDYSLEKPYFFEWVHVLSDKARPTMLLLMLEFNLNPAKKENASTDFEN